MAGPRQRVIGYGRVSTEEQESNYSLDAQRSRFENLCKQNHWQSLGFFPETGSGTSVLNRPVLCNLLQRIQDGGVDGLWVKETDRLSRPENLGDLSLISQTLESKNTLLIVDTRSLDLREDNSVLMLDFEGVMAKHFRRQLLRNMKRGKIRKAELGRKAAGSDVFGYRTNGVGEYIPNPDEAKIVQLIYELYAKDFTLRRVRAELKRRHIQTKLGRDEWSLAILTIILRNRMYLGVFTYQRTRQPRDEDGGVYKQKGDPIVVGSPDRPNHPPIIERWLFELAQQKLDANRKKNTHQPYMATGLLKCPVCGAHMHAKRSSTGPRNVRRTEVKYTCSKKPNCPSKRLHVAEINDLLWKALVELFVAPERIHSLIAPSAELDVEAGKKQLAAIEKEERANREKLERLLNLYLEGNIPQASYVVKSSELETESERLALTKSDLQRRVQDHGKQDINAELIQTIRILSRSHRRFTEEQKVKVFRSLIKETRITASGVELEMYVQPTQNVWWKYRQKSVRRKTYAPQGQTVRVGIPQPHWPDNSVYTTGQAASILRGTGRSSAGGSK